MANHKSAEKAIRKIETRTAINTSRRSRIRTFIKKLEEVITSGDKAKATSMLNETQSEIMKGVTKGVLKLNTASRKVSRLSAKIKSMA